MTPQQKAQCTISYLESGSVIAENVTFYLSKMLTNNWEEVHFCPHYAIYSAYIELYYVKKKLENISLKTLNTCITHQTLSFINLVSVWPS